MNIAVTYPPMTPEQLVWMTAFHGGLVSESVSNPAMCAHEAVLEFRLMFPALTREEIAAETKKILDTLSGDTFDDCRTK